MFSVRVTGWWQESCHPVDFVSQTVKCDGRSVRSLTVLQELSRFMAWPDFPLLFFKEYAENLIKNCEKFEKYHIFATEFSTKKRNMKAKFL